MDIDIIYNEDCFETFKRIGDKSIDSIVTDAPYELGFMGKKWDKTGIAYNIKMWEECLRVLKPGGHLLSFGGTRTSHRMACAIEDAGFEIRDTVMWVYGQGFPKSLDISKAIDKRAGKHNPELVPTKQGNTKHDRGITYATDTHAGFRDISEPATPEAKQWEGWGTGLKPAFEPVILARKPISEKTVAENVLKWGTGAINIDASRILTRDNLNGGGYDPDGKSKKDLSQASSYVIKPMHKQFIQPQGRFPSNLIHDGSDEVLAEFAKANIHSAGSERQGNPIYAGVRSIFNIGQTGGNSQRFGDTGTAARFFYCAKASRSERDAGLEGMPLVECFTDGLSRDMNKANSGNPIPLAKNNHPTVKPLALMRYLIKLITPPNGIVLDPFTGSGSTLVAAKQLGFNYIGCELDKGYYNICMKRIEEHKTKLL